MNCTEILAKKRLSRAIKHRFIIEDEGGDLRPVGYNTLAKIAYDQQCRAYADGRSKCDPLFFFEHDRKYVVPSGKLIDPENIDNTRALLYGIMAVYGNRYMWSRDTHAKILRNSRRSVIRLSERSNTKVEPQLLYMDPLVLLHKPKCNRITAIEAFQAAEKLYRTGSKTRGRSLVQRRSIPDSNSDDFKTFLTFQLPNIFTCDSIIREAPASVVGLTVARLSRPSMPGESNTNSNCDGAVSGPNPRQEPARRGGHKELPAGGRKFMDAQALRGAQKLGDRFVAKYLSTFNQILAEEDCRKVILDITGAQDVLPLSYATPRLFIGKIDRSRVTPKSVTGDNWEAVAY